MAGKDARSGAALKELCISHIAIRLAPTRLYAGQVVSRAAKWWVSTIWSLRRVRASEMPKIRPLPTAVSVARCWPDRRRPAWTKQSAMAAIAAAAGQYAKDPNRTSRVLTMRDTDKIVTPTARIRVPSSRSEERRVGKE